MYDLGLGEAPDHLSSYTPRDIAATADSSVAFKSREAARVGDGGGEEERVHSSRAPTGSQGHQTGGNAVEEEGGRQGSGERGAGAGRQSTFRTQEAYVPAS